MAKPIFKNSLKQMRVSDVRGMAQLATQATLGVADMVEGVHQSVWRTLGAPGGAVPGQTRGLTGLIYKGVRGVTQRIGDGLGAVLNRLQPLLESLQVPEPETPQRAAVIAALNGVLGDHLLASNNPLATPMALRYQGEALSWPIPAPLPGATGKVLLLIHGLCMNDLQWCSQGRVREGAQRLVQDHGAVLAAALGYTPLYLRYNSGLHTSVNGHELAALLEQWVAHWPTPVEELTVVAHSMGGLLIRSAVYSAQQQALRWPGILKNIVFLGTPHHGAPLERAGNWIDVVLSGTPYTAPFAKLGQLRSAGITDLRYGHVQDLDWQGRNRFRRTGDGRQVVPLPQGVACYTVAATTAPQRSTRLQRLSQEVIGDGLVPLPSALGQHSDKRRSLIFAKSAQWIAYRTNHMELLNSPEVTRQLLKWLTPQQENIIEAEKNLR
jgi:pimeloyl-ACP methyl ester carboxylesterase